MRRIFLLAMLFLFTASAIGCGGNRERGKNSDLDRPIPHKK